MKKAKKNYFFLSKISLSMGHTVLIYTLFIFSYSCQSPTKLGKTENSLDKDTIYSYGSKSFGGTGKYFLKREIAEVMGYEGASWLEREEREREESVSLAIKNFDLEENFHVADIGAGSGYYTFRISRLLKQGKIYAVDIQPEMLFLINEKIKKNDIHNIITKQGSEKTPNLPLKSIDLAFMVDVYHELLYPFEVLQALKESLKPGGKLILLEYRAEDPAVPIKQLHKMKAQQVIKELAFAGFNFVENKTVLPWQHLLIFKRP